MTCSMTYVKIPSNDSMFIAFRLCFFLDNDRRFVYLLLESSLVGKPEDPICCCESVLSIRLNWEGIGNPATLSVK